MINKKFFKILECRACKSNKIKKILNLKDMPLGDKYAKYKNQYDYLVSSNLVKCSNCELIQNDSTADPKILYSHYLSRPAAVNQNLSKDFESYAEYASKFLSNKKNLIVEIGSNDGSFINYFRKKGYNNTLGIEPAENLAKNANKSGIPTLNNFFDYSAVESIEKKFGINKAKLIIHNHALSNIHDLNKVSTSVKKILSSDGVYCLQTFYMYDVLDKYLIENFNHEHLSYFSVKTISNYLKFHGLEVFDAIKVDAKGGSIRVFAKHFSKDLKTSKRFKSIIAAENKKNDEKLFNNLNKKINDFSKSIKDIIKKNKYKNIIGYGTSIGATTFIYQYNIANKISFFVDDDTFRQNRFSPGSNIPVKSSNKITISNPDLIIIFAPLYYKKIIENIKNLKRNSVDVLLIWPEIKLIKLK